MKPESPASLGLDPASLRRSFAHYPTGVAVVTALPPEGPVALVVSSFISVSLAPPLVAFCPARISSTWPRIAAMGHCVVSVLAEEQEALSAKLARREVQDRFEGVAHRAAPSGAPILDGAVAWFDCVVVQSHVAGDHDLVVLEVLAHGEGSGREPLVFHRSAYRKLPSR